MTAQRGVVLSVRPGAVGFIQVKSVSTGVVRTGQEGYGLVRCG